MTDVDMTTVVPVSEMARDDDEERGFLEQQLATAKAYLTSFKWCHGIKEAYFGDGVGKVIAVFLLRIDSPPEVDEWLWVVTGDIPSVYMVTDGAPTPVEALTFYCDLMEDWVAAVRGESELPLDEIFPVDALATPGNADDLESRIGFLRERIFPTLRSFAEG